jgi:hypothetical protein
VFGAATVYGACQALGIVLASFSIRRLLRQQRMSLKSPSDLGLASASVLS